MRGPDAIAEMKLRSGRDALLIGSSDLALTLASMDLIDEYRLMVNPLAFGTGKPVLAD